MAPIETLHGNVAVKEEQLVYLGFSYQIQFCAEERYPANGLVIRPFSIVGRAQEEFDGCELVVEPKGSSHIVGDMNPRKLIADTPISGSGYFLRLTKEGKIETYKFSKQEITERRHEATFDDTIASVWISNWKECPYEPFCVVQVVSPPYQSGDERVIDPNDESLPAEFREQYFSLLRTGEPCHPELMVPLPK